MKNRFGILLASCAVFLTGCATAPQSAVALSSTAFAAKTTRVGVSMTALPKADTSFPGAACLLCLAAASMANSTLTAHTQTLPTDDLSKVKAELAERIRKQGLDVVLIDDVIKFDDLPSSGANAPNFASKSFAGLQQKYKLDKLVVIDIAQLGISRSYAQYFPTGEPQGFVRGSAYLVNLKDNAYEWYLPISQLKSASGKWDEPTTFPSLSNAYFQAIELARDSLLQPFSN